MILFAHTITARLEYVAAFLGNHFSGIPLKLTSDKTEFSAYPGARINYSDKRITADECWLPPFTLLFEQGIRPQPITCFETNGYKAFFKTEGDFPFDILAAVFYLLSRYEEYLPHEKDLYGRYAHTASLAFKEGFLTIPLIHYWLKDFSTILSHKFPLFSSGNDVFRFLPTYDIDEAFSFKHKGWMRNTGAALKDLLKGNRARLRLRLKVRANQAPDPFDSYDWMDDLHEQYKLEPRYFFLVAGKNSAYDRNIRPRKPVISELIRRHAGKYDIGVHPSWQSGDDPALLKNEKEMIERAAGITVRSSRQHFIRFHLPGTFRRLIANGINEDFSMGYGSINGFRASVSVPFYWYDLENESTTSLLLYPFCYMDANSFYEQQYSPQKALEEMHHYYTEVKKANGLLITIWHNTFLGTEERFKGWREVYQDFVKQLT
ncbi:MAG: polysaccharide deacetylase family protein [Sphingobacteriales bacterium]|nr:polysaccharide deacetylase family protein [Sphingobacteriales bacterium]